MIQLNLSEEQALAIYALIGETSTECAYLNQVREYLENSLSKGIREHIWRSVCNHDDPVYVDDWDGIIDRSIMEYKTQHAD